MRELTVIVPFWNGHETIWRLLASLPAGIPVIVVDDHSDKAFTAESAEGAEAELVLGGPSGGASGEARSIEVIRPKEKGYFSGAVNAGMAACGTDVLILNQDVWFRSDGWLEHLEELRKRYQVFGDGVMKHPVWPLGYVQGTFMYVAREVIARVGLLNERDYPLWGATCEYQLRACRKGFRAHPTKDFYRWMAHEPRPKGSKFGPAITELVRREPDRRKEFIRTPPAISVVVPCYNYGRYLRDAIGSLIGGETCLGDLEGQSFQSFEVIIVDDASTDETEKIGRELEDPWKGIRYIRHKSNRGTPYTLNTGVEAARGQYITILSADDMLEPWHLETLYRTCLAMPRGVAYGNLRLLKGGQRDKLHRLPEYDFERLLHKNPMSAGIMYPKEAWKEAGGYPKAMVYGREDWAFNIALGVKGWCGVHSGGAPGYLIRREKQNRSLTTATADWYRYFRQQLVGIFPEIYAGDRPMGCCGKKAGGVVKAKASKTGTNAGTRKEVLVGAKGMAIVVFQKDIAAPKTIYGPVTGTAYQFGGRRKAGRVDVRDLETKNLRNPGFLEMYEHGKPLFKRTADPGKPPEKKAVVAPEPSVAQEYALLKAIAGGKVDTEGAELGPSIRPSGATQDEVGGPGAYTLEEEEAVGERIIEEEDSRTPGVPDPGVLTVKAIRELSGTLALEEWRFMLAMEREGKQRASAIAFIEAAIENLRG